MELNLDRLQRILHDETGLVFGVELVGQERDIIRLRLNTICVFEVAIDELRDELTVAEKLPQHLRVDAMTLHMRFSLLQTFAHAPSEHSTNVLHEILQSENPEGASREFPLPASFSGAIDGITMFVEDVPNFLELLYAPIIFGLSDTAVQKLANRLQ